jgi:hypothetical protein
MAHQNSKSNLVESAAERYTTPLALSTSGEYWQKQPPADADRLERCCEGNGVLLASDQVASSEAIGK